MKSFVFVAAAALLALTDAGFVRLPLKKVPLEKQLVSKTLLSIDSCIAS